MANKDGHKKKAILTDSLIQRVHNYNSFSFTLSRLSNQLTHVPDQDLSSIEVDQI